ncbi:hypothetical protein [Thermoanaerobacterium thermosaccharolyticum]|uniref:hypothetical protein n=1 Tax=Thermoanaerobacterium thermosaccharolyticum TaxID=1517 RepID=UPI003DA7B3D0
MIRVPIQDLESDIIKDVEVFLPSDKLNVYEESYFSWAASPLIAKINSNNISGGILKAWHHVPVFNEIETHAEPEMFYFISGIALMLFIDLVDEIPNLDTAQIVRIRPGTQLIISKGKGHFIPVAESEEPVHIIVVSPRVDAPKIQLSTSIGAL